MWYIRPGGFLLARERADSPGPCRVFRGYGREMHWSPHPGRAPTGLKHLLRDVRETRRLVTRHLNTQSNERRLCDGGERWSGFVSGGALPGYSTVFMFFFLHSRGLGPLHRPIRETRVRPSCRKVSWEIEP